MKNKILTTIALGSILGGCVGIPTYQPPIDGDLATITVPKFSTKYKVFGGFSGGNVMVATKGPDGCGKFSAISKRGVGKQDISVNVLGNNELFVSVSRFLGNSTCNISMSFFPKSEGDYRVLFRTGGDYCGARIVEVNPDGAFADVESKHAYASTWNGAKVCSKKSDL